MLMIIMSLRILALCWAKHFFKQSEIKKVLIDMAFLCSQWMKCLRQLYLILLAAMLFNERADETEAEV